MRLSEGELAIAFGALWDHVIRTIVILKPNTN
jgi:hypothetical protein